jgi:hypothetical protein
MPPIRDVSAGLKEYVLVGRLVPSFNGSALQMVSSSVLRFSLVADDTGIIQADDLQKL